MRIAPTIRRLVVSGLLGAMVSVNLAGGAAAAPSPATATPIEHVVVIFQENVSFDHYFGTYPVARNPAGEPGFTARPDTPTVNGLSSAVLTNNPNLSNPARLDRSQAVTCDMDHGYTAEQKAFDAGLMDKFVQNTGAKGPGCDPSQVMDYYDGNSVTALWNYAQSFAMSDNSYGTTFGPSTPGALNLVSGQTHGATPLNVPGKVVNGTVMSDLDPTFDDCSKGTTAAMSGKNVGDLLNAKSITWGWFEGGFRPTSTVNGVAVCGASSVNVANTRVTDYIPHHEPFQYYQSTANPHHLSPSSVAMIGQTDQANHQYDLTDFWAAVDAGHLPAVSFLKAKAYQDGHAGYSDPLDEQTFLVDTINRLENLPEWRTTAVIISYDDSDGWYDHVLGPIVSQSNDPGADALTGPGSCGQAAPGTYQDRCGYGPRLPLLVISPWARTNFVDHRVTDQSSILRFIEDNWSLGRIGDQSFDAKAGPLSGMFDFQRGPSARALFLNDSTGEPVAESPASTANLTLAPGKWAAYRFHYNGDGSNVLVSLSCASSQACGSFDAYSPINPAPSGTPIGSSRAVDSAGTQQWVLGSTAAGNYTILVRNPGASSANVTLSTVDATSGGAGPTLQFVSAAN